MTISFRFIKTSILDINYFFLAFDIAGHDRRVSSLGKTLDLTAPEAGKIFVGNTGSHNAILSTVDLFVRWEGFADKESGIKDILLGVGSTNESTDILDFYLVEGEFASIKESMSMLDGYQYFIILKVEICLAKLSLMNPY